MPGLPVIAVTRATRVRHTDAGGLGRRVCAVLEGRTLRWTYTVHGLSDGRFNCRGRYRIPAPVLRRFRYVGGAPWHAPE